MGNHRQRPTIVEFSSIPLSSPTPMFNAAPAIVRYRCAAICQENSDCNRNPAEIISGLPGVRGNQGTTAIPSADWYGCHPIFGWAFRFQDGHTSDLDPIDHHQKLRTMPMKNPPHPGLSVRHDCLEPLELNVTEAAKRLGVSRKHLSDIVNCHAGISPQMTIRLDMAFGGGADTWLHLQVAYDLAQAMKHVDEIRVERILPAA